MKMMDKSERFLEIEESVKRSYQKNLEGLILCFEAKVAAYEKLEKSKMRLQQEMDGLLIELDHQRQIIFNLEKRQKELEQVCAARCPHPYPSNSTAPLGHSSVSLAPCGPWWPGEPPNVWVPYVPLGVPTTGIEVTFPFPGSCNSLIFYDRPG